MLQSIEYYEGEGPIHRSSKSPNKIISQVRDANTVYGAMSPIINERGDNPAVAIRERLGDGKYGPFKWQSYNQLKQAYETLGWGLLSLGLKQRDRLGVYAKNRPEWAYAIFACAMQNFTLVPLYDTLGPEATTYIINHSELEIIISSGENLPKLLAGASECVTFKRVILLDEVSPDLLAQAQKAGISVIPLKAIQQKGESQSIATSPAGPDDLFVIMYTSGTTGVPKGVMLSNSNLVAAMSAVHFGSLEITPDDVHLSYLPLAHIYEMMVMLAVFYAGGRVGYWRGDILGLLEDIQTLQPTFLIGAPRVYNRIYDKINATINSGFFIQRALFNYAYQSKLSQLHATGEDNSALWNRLVFSKIAQLLGGRIRFILSGSAPLAPNVQEFLRICFCCPVVQGYGLTETCATLSMGDVLDWTVGHVGPPLVVTEVKLVDIPEMNYTSSSTPQQGEVCARGPTIFKGYYKMPEKTAEVIDRDGWFHTGDVGEWLPNGTLKIIDRKKNIFKLAQGEYVAAEYLETVYLRCPYTMQIFVYGDSYQNYLVAVCIPDPETLIPWARSQGIKGDLPQLCEDKRVKQLIFNSLMKVATTAKLEGFERIKNIHLEPVPMSIENGFLTPTMKSKRNELQKHYKEVIQRLYSEPRMDGATTKANL